MSTINKSKEAILQQMYNRVAAFWGVESVEDLDPLVKLMMQGLASMLYDVYNEIEDVHVRMLESLAGALTPSVMINPRPAHAIAQVYPTDPVAYIDRKTVFLDKKIPQELQKQEIKTLSFVPLARIRLVSGKIKYLVTERIFHRIEENGSKTRIAQARILNEKTNNTLWIAMNLHPETESLEGLSFFMDFPHAVGKYEKYGNLPYSRWSIDGQKLEMKTGLPSIPEEDGESFENESFSPGHSLLNETDANISDLYRIQYLTVTNSVRLETLRKKPFPEEISPFFPEHITETLEPCYWIKVVLPPYITAEDIHDTVVHLNTFPVANKTRYSTSHNLSEARPDIIPMRVENREHFVSIEKISDSHGYEYKPVPYTAGGNMNPGFYSLKRGGVERFDRRNAGESLERMIDVLRDESAAFSSLNADNMRNLISGMQEGLKQIATKYEQSQMGSLSMPSYLLLNQVSKNETVFVEYWATCCELANGLRAGKILTPQSSVFLVKDSCRLLTETRGGKSEAGASGRIDAFRYVLTARDQILTHEDVANFCSCELGAKVTRVNVLRGVAVSPKPKEGLIRTIDISLTPSPGCEQIVREMQTDLLVMLHRKSPDSFNYRIVLETKS
ncbi:hypothetical protein AGMMS50239_39880 [Bacteroidia bacterium]|nr:hypothetical protein AGMMS50239_39880 [Bacteroidia bacterium]